MIKTVNILVVMVLLTVNPEVFAQTQRAQSAQSGFTAAATATPVANTNYGQPANGQLFNPNGIPMIFVEGNGAINSFYIGMYEVTQRAWKAVMGYNPSVIAVSDNHPVNGASWDDVQLFIAKLNELTGRNYRLPTEAEWDYAARGGNLSRGHTYSGSNNINDVGVYKKNSKGPQKVGSKKPNELNVYDMTGNLTEWCNDCWGNDCSYRVLRGGSYVYDAKVNLLANRSRQKAGGLKPDKGYYYIGFRLVLQ